MVCGIINSRMLTALMAGSTVVFGVKRAEPLAANLVLASPPMQTGFAWSAAGDADTLRHSCQHEHKLQQWGWQAFDGAHYGYQTVGDSAVGVVRLVYLPGIGCAAGPWVRKAVEPHGAPMGAKCAPVNHHRPTPVSFALACHSSAQNLTFELLQPDAWPAPPDGGSSSRAAHRAECRPWSVVINGTSSSSRRGSSGGSAPARRKGVKEAPAYVSVFAYLAAATGTLGAANTPEAEAGAADLTIISGQRPTGLDGTAAESFALLMWGDHANQHPSHARTHLTRVAAKPGSVSGRRGSDSETGNVDRYNAPELARAHVTGVRLPNDDVWRAEDVLKEQLRDSARRGALAVAQAKQKAAKRAMAAGDPTGGAGAAAARVDRDLERPVFPVLNGSVAEASNLMVVQQLLAVPFSIEWTFVPHGCFEEAGEPADANVDAAAAGTEDSRWVRLAEALGLGVGTTGRTAPVHRALFHAELCARLGLCHDTGGVTPGGEGRHEQAATPAGAEAALRVQLAGHALSNLLGSVTYFHGRQLVAGAGVGGAPRESVPHGLLTGVPSRSFFPRGFLWDEGFHQLVASQWDAAASRAVLASWLDTMDASGWMAREQILGGEARSRVPEQFRVQRPDIANPPTLLLPVLALAVDGLCGVKAAGSGASGGQAVVRADGSVDADDDADAVAAFCGRHDAGNPACLYACRNTTAPPAPAAPAGATRPATLAFLRAAFVKLALHYDWYARSQAGGRPGTFRWRGATQDHNFASGFDDYPRGALPHDGDENVDLLAWMAMAAHVMADLAPVAGGTPAQAARYAADAEARTALLERHWSEAAGAYCDIGVLRMPPPAAAARNAPRAGAAATPEYELGHVCHIGYVSLLPVLLRLVPPGSPRVGAALAAMSDEGALWSRHGLRSLSAADPLFGTREDYWRGAMWVNMNYLAVAALRHYGTATGPHAGAAAGLAQRLSAAVVDTVAHGYASTGFLWENYDSRDGHGRGTHPFTGWTALVALMVADRYPF
jgi:hypothetical protein